MDKERAKALQEWVNCCGTDNIKSVASLTEFSHKESTCMLLNIVQLIDPDTSTDAPCTSSDPEHIFRFVASYLEGFYDQKLDAIVSVHNAVCGDELEIAKFVTLLLCSAVQCNNVQMFVEKITKLADDTQFHLKYLIEIVLQQMESGGVTCTFGELLMQRATTRELQMVDTDSSKCSPRTVVSPVEFTNSPLKSLLASPQVKSKQNQFVLNKLNQKVTTLQMSLDTQAHIQSELEQEVAVKNAEIEAKDCKIRDLNKEAKELMAEVEKLDALQHYKSDFEKAEQENERLKHKLEKLETFKEQCGNLEKNMANFLEEKRQFEHQLKDTQQVRSSCERYKSQIHKLEFQSSELAASLKRRDSQVVELENQRDEAKRAFQQATELWEDKLQERKRGEFMLEEAVMGENMAVVNQDGRIIQLEFENARMREELASAPDQLEMQALKERLENTQLSKAAYEKSFVDAKCKLLELENELSQLESQSRAREEAMQRKLEASEKSFAATKEKLDHTNRELSGVQTELAVARHEVEVHVQAADKQRKSVAKALEEAAAKISAVETESQRKQQELCQQMEQTERNMEEQLMSERAGYKLKIRALSQALQSAKEAKEKIQGDYGQIQQEKVSVMEERDRVKAELTAAVSSLDARLRKALKDTASAVKALEDEQVRHTVELKSVKEGLEREKGGKNKVIQEQELTRQELGQKEALLVEMSNELNTVKQDLEKETIEKGKITQEQELTKQELGQKEALLVEMSNELNTVKQDLEKETIEKGKTTQEQELTKQELGQKEALLAEMSNELNTVKQDLEKETIEKGKIIQEQELTKQELGQKEALLAEMSNELNTVKQDLEKETIEKGKTTQELGKKEALLAEMSKSSAHLICELNLIKEDLGKETLDKGKVVQEQGLTKQELKYTEALLVEMYESSAQLNGELNSVKANLEKETLEKSKVIQELELIKQDLTQKTALLDEMSKTSERLSSELKSVNAQAKEYKENYEQLSDENQRERQELSQRCEASEKELRELRCLSGAEREQVLRRLEEVMREKEGQENKFEAKENEIKNAAKAAEIERDQLRDAYEEMLSAVKTELDTEVNLRQDIRNEYSQAKVAWENREQQLLDEQTTAEAKKQEYWNNSQKQAQDLKELQHQMKSLETELQSKVNSAQEFTLTCTKLKQELDATESKLLETTRSKNLLETELLEEKRAHKDKAAQLSFQMEQLKVSHSSAVQEILANSQEERKKHQQRVKDLTTQQDHSHEQLQAAHSELASLGNDRNTLKRKLSCGKSKTRDLEGELEKAQLEFADKQKAMLEGASKNHRKLQEDYEAERAFWKTKLDQAARETRDVRDDLYDRSQQHASELLELRKRARNREEEVALEAKNLREENRCLEKHTGKLNECVAELEENLKRSEVKEKELVEEKEKCAELQVSCKEYASKEENYKSYIEALKADAHKEREQLANEVQMERKQREDMLESHLQETSELTVKLGDLERTKDQEKNEEMHKLSDQSRAREEGLVSEMEELKSKLKQNVENLEQMENSLKISREEKQKGDEELQNLKQEWDSKSRDLEERIAELEQERDGIADLKSTLDTIQEEREAMMKQMTSAEEGNATLEQQLTEEAVINRRLAIELRSLEAQLTQADRMIREQKKELEKLKDSPEHPVKAECGRRNPEELRIKPKAMKIQENISEVSSEDTTSESDDTRLRIEDLNASTSSRLSLAARKDSSHQLGRFSSSMTSTSSRASMHNGVQTRRQSAIYLHGKTPPEMRTTSSGPYFISDPFTMRTEEENDCEYNWDRLSELKRRNATCLPHLKTSYAVEMQLLKPDPVDGENAIKNASSSTRKRKSLHSTSDAVMSRSSSARTTKAAPSSKSDTCLISVKRRKSTVPPSDMVQASLESLRSKSSVSRQKASQENVPPASGDPPLEGDAKQSRGGVSFSIIDDAPRNAPVRPSFGRRRTITRSLGSSKLLDNGAKEECKKVLQKKQGSRGAKKMPLRPRQLKK